MGLSPISTVAKGLCILLCLWGSMFFVIPILRPVSAVSPEIANCTSGINSVNYNYRTGGVCPPTVSGISVIFVTAVNIVLALSVFIFFLIILVTGVQFVSSTGDPERIEGARRSLMMAIMGFGLVLGAFLIVDTIIVVTGTQNANFWVDGSGIHINLTTSGKVTTAGGA